MEIYMCILQKWDSTLYVLEIIFNLKNIVKLQTPGLNQWH